MAYVYPEVQRLQNTDKVGSTECVALVQHYAHAPQTSLWKQGATVLGNAAIAPGTAIATFVRGRYQSQRHGNHAAFFLRFEDGKIVVMDQWRGDDKAKVSERPIISLKLKQLPDGAFPRASNNADAYCVIE